MKLGDLARKERSRMSCVAMAVLKFGSGVLEFRQMTGKTASVIDSFGQEYLYWLLGGILR